MTQDGQQYRPSRCSRHKYINVGHELLASPAISEASVLQFKLTNPCNTTEVARLRALFIAQTKAPLKCGVGIFLPFECFLYVYCENKLETSDACKLKLKGNANNVSVWVTVSWCTPINGKYMLPVLSFPICNCNAGVTHN